MSARLFLDTNVVVYSFDSGSPAKRRRAREIMAGRDWTVSWQVVQEFSHLALHRFARPMKPNDLADFVDLVLWPRCSVLPSPAIYQAAITLHEKTQWRFYDCLIVAAAAASGAATLYSEDLQHRRRIGPLTIVNPFIPTA